MAKNCRHEQIHYMGVGPLPETLADCRWNYVCRKCRVWLKFKVPIVLDANDKYSGKLPEPTLITEWAPGLDYGVPQPIVKRAAPKKPAEKKAKAKAKAHK